MTTEVEVRDHTLLVDGLRLHYRDWGAVTAPPLVLLHGMTRNARFWDSFAAPMADRFRVLALDVRGHGESEHTADYHRDRLLAEFAAFADALALRRFALLGHSMGGLMSYHYAAEQPDRVTRLVIVDAGPDGATSPGIAAIHAALRVLPTVSFADLEEAFQRSRERNPRAPVDVHRQVARDNLVQRADGRWVLRFDAARLHTYLDHPAAEAGQWALLARIRCPTLVVHGAESDILLAATAERMAQTIPDCRLVHVRDAGHTVPLDNPAGFLAAVRPFLLQEVA